MNGGVINASIKISPVRILSWEERGYNLRRLIERHLPIKDQRKLTGEK